MNVALTKLLGDHDLKFGGTFKSFPIDEVFGFGITDPGFNDPSSDAYNPDLAPYDLTRGGQPLDFSQKRTGSYAALFVQDNIRYKNLTANLGLRYDHNNLPVTESQVEPRIGLAYYIEGTGTVLRGSYNRIFFTPEYENILFSSSPLAASLVPPEVKSSRELGGGVLLVSSERQNAYTVGAEQGVGREARLAVDFWWRRSRNAGNQDQFLNTGIVFPLAFDSGRYNGWNVRVESRAEASGPRVPVSRSRARNLRSSTGGRALSRRRVPGRESPVGLSSSTTTRSSRPRARSSGTWVEAESGSEPTCATTPVSSPTRHPRIS